MCDLELETKVAEYFASIVTVSLNVKVLVGAFNQEKALVGAFSIIVKTDCETDVGQSGEGC